MKSSESYDQRENVTNESAQTQEEVVPETPQIHWEDDAEKIGEEIFTGEKNVVFLFTYRHILFYMFFYTEDGYFSKRISSRQNYSLSKNISIERSSEGYRLIEAISCFLERACYWAQCLIKNAQ